MQRLFTFVGVMTLCVLASCAGQGSAPGTLGHDHFRTGPLGRALEAQRLSRGGSHGRGFSRGYGKAGRR